MIYWYFCYICIYKSVTMKAIINLGSNFGTLNGVIKTNSEIKKIVFSKLKENKAKLLIDTDQTLMYELN